MKSFLIDVEINFTSQSFAEILCISLCKIEINFNLINDSKFNHSSSKI